MTILTSRRHPMVESFRELAASPEADGRRLLLDGAHLLAAADAAGCELEVVAASPAAQTGADGSLLLERLRRGGVEVIQVTDDVLRVISPVKSPSGIVAIARKRAASIADMSRPDEALIVVAADVQDPGNLGSLMRAAEAGGATGMLVTGTSAHPFGWKTLRGSMGSALRLPVAPVALADLAALLRGSHVAMVAAVPCGGVPADDFDWTGRHAILLGGEGPGLPRALVDAADHRVSLPMAKPVESLNVAVAGALLVYAARRVRALRGMTGGLRA